MQLIILLIIIFLVWRWLKKRKNENSDENYSAASAMSTASAANADSPKAVKNFQKALNTAAKGLDPDAIEAMGQVAVAYASGFGTAKDFQKAAQWKLKQLDAMLHLKIYWDFSDFKDYYDDFDSATEFFLNGEVMPVDLGSAWKAAFMLFEAEEPRSVLLVKEVIALEHMGIGKVKSPEEAMEIYIRETNNGNHFAMYRMAKALEVTLDEKNAKEAASLLQKAADAGNLRALYDLGNKDTIPNEYNQLKISYLIERYAQAVTKDNAKKALENEMQAAGVASDTASQIDWLLQKAGWPAASANYSEPVKPELDGEFMKARDVERQGKDFKKAVKLYQPAAEGGHPEAMRRLGNLLVNVRSLYEGDADDNAGRQWLEKAAAAGSVLASFDLGKKDTNPAHMAALAKTGLPDALHHLAAMVLVGWGGPANETVGLALTRVAFSALNDPVKRGDGEGMEWCRKLCLLQKCDEEHQIYWAGNADKADYRPGSYALANLLFARSGGPEFQRAYAAKAYNAGYEKSYGMMKYLRREQDDWKFYCDEEIRKHLNKKGYLSSSPLSGEQLVALAQRNLAKKKADAEAAYKQKGLPQLGDGVEIPEINIDEAQISEEIDTVNAQANLSVRDMPHYIYDDLGRSWEWVDLIGTDTAVYRLERQYGLGTDIKDYLNAGSVYISNRHLRGKNRAELFSQSFHW